MNTLTAYTTTNPFGETAECAQFVIDDTSTPFTLFDITVSGQQYTLSLWIKADASETFITCGKTINVNTFWTKHVITFTASSVNVAFKFNTTGTYYIYRPKLELGNKATDWTPAPEDTDSKVDDTSNELHQLINNQNKQITDNYEAAILRALEEYTKTGDFEEFKNTLNAELGSMSDDIINNYNSTSSQIGNLNQELNSKFEELYGYIHIDPTVPSISLGSGSSAITLTIENDVIMFKKNGQSFGHWDGVDFHTGNIVVDVNERAQFGNFAYIPRSDGSLSFLKVGGA